MLTKPGIAASELANGNAIGFVRHSFGWTIPEHYNIGVDVCDRWADKEPSRLALTHVDDSGVCHDYTYGSLKSLSNRLANVLLDHRIVRGDRVAILLPQSMETAISHIAIYKMGGIAIPLFMLFGTDALGFRLADSGARAVVTNRSGVGKLAKIRHQLPDLERVFCVDGCVADLDWVSDFHQEMERQSDNFTPVNTLADDPALIVYTSGTTGQPKGALHAHRTLLGHLPGVEMSHDFLPQPGDKIWTPADWAWIGGLLDVLMPALHHGIVVVAHRFEKFDGEAAFRFIEQHRIRNAFIPPTALKMMRSVDHEKLNLTHQMRTIASGGETLGAELLEWGKAVFGLTINEFYGQTECNMIVSSCGVLHPAQPGIMGFAVPGHDVDVINDEGEICSDGEIGAIAVRQPDPVAFIEYWNNPEATRDKFLGEWLLTGDSGVKQPNGAIRFVGRDDDLITSSGYRIGPGEIENCLISHPGVAIAAVVGKPDEARTEIVKAFVKLNPGYVPGEPLLRELQRWVKTRLAAYEYPREIEFVDSLPMTTTGKIIRRELRDR